MNFNRLKFGATIGIIGEEQSGKIMAQSAQKIGSNVTYLDPNPDSLCKSVADVFITAEYDNEEALDKLGQQLGVITYEFENISARQLKYLTQQFNIPQNYQAIELLQDRLTEKQTLESAGIKIVPYVSLKDEKNLNQAIETLSYPFIVEARFGGYDSKGQILVRNDSNIEEAKALVPKHECVAEKFLDLDREVSLTVTIGNQNQIAYFPLQENEYRNQILFKAIIPVRCDKEQEARKEVNKIIEKVYFVDTSTVGFFIDKSNHLYVNEVAPKSHSSGHYTIEACDYSQFDTHILAVTGQDLPQEIEVLKPAVMMNLLGCNLDLLEDKFGDHPEWYVHIYGKTERKPDRKMGHMTILINNVNETENKMLKQSKGRE